MMSPTLLQPLVVTLATGSLLACGELTNNQVAGMGPMDAHGCDYPGIDPAAANITEERNLQVATDPAKYLPRLVSDLTAHTSSANVKAKRIHDWIAANIAYDGNCFGGPNANAAHCLAVDPATTLQAGRAVCEGYAKLFLEMATEAGLNAVAIYGNARFTSGSSYTAEGTAHVWNGVQLDDGSWGLIDTTWDAGGYDLYSAGLVRQYSYQWYLLDPYMFLSTHWPGIPAYQFMQYSKEAPQSTPVSFQVWEASTVVVPTGTVSSCEEK